MIFKRCFKVRRFFLILFRALVGVHSPSLKRKVKISDIWKNPHYETNKKQKRGEKDDSCNSKSNQRNCYCGICCLHNSCCNSF